MFQTACHSRIFLLYPQHHRSNHVKSTIVEIEETDAASPATAGKGLVTDNHARLRLQASLKMHSSGTLNTAYCLAQVHASPVVYSGRQDRLLPIGRIQLDRQPRQRRTFVHRCSSNQQHEATIILRKPVTQSISGRPNRRSHGQTSNSNKHRVAEWASTIDTVTVGRKKAKKHRPELDNLLRKHLISSHID